MNPTTSGQIGGAIKQNIELISLRNKKWDECSSEEKVEKLRAEMRELNYLSTNVTNLRMQVEALEEHAHADGKVVIPVKTPNKLLGGLAYRQSNLD
jgi:hypothetical protein